MYVHEVWMFCPWKMEYWCRRVQRISVGIFHISVWDSFFYMLIAGNWVMVLVRWCALWTFVLTCSVQHGVISMLCTHQKWSVEMTASSTCIHLLENTLMTKTLIGAWRSMELILIVGVCPCYCVRIMHHYGFCRNRISSVRLLCVS